METYGESIRLAEMKPERTDYDTALVDLWSAEDEEAGPRPMAVPGKRIRHSWAGKCPRQMAYYITGREAPPMDREGVWVTRLGTKVHELWQDAIDALYVADTNVHAKFEVACETHISSGHADSLVKYMKPAGRHREVHSEVVELKTINGMGYKQVVKGGPRISHVLQACVNGYALDADSAALVYLPMETNRQGGEFTIGATFRIPGRQMRYIAERELKRWEAVLRTIDRGYLPPRQIVDDRVPIGAEVVDALSGKLDKGGKTWQCGYCPFQLQCHSDGAGLVKVTDEKEVESLW